MKRHVLLYGAVGGILVAVLQWTQYRFLVIEHSAEIYGALIAVLFAGLGIWLGLRLKSARERIVVREVPVPGPQAAAPFLPNDKKREDLNMTRRELEILELVAQGLTTAKSPLNSLSAKTRSRPTAAARSTSWAPNAARRLCS